MNAQELARQISIMTKNKPLKLPKIPNGKAIVIEQEYPVEKDNHRQFSVFKLPTRAIKQTEISMDYSKETDSPKRQLFSKESKKKLKKRMKSIQGKKDEYKNKNNELSREYINQIKEKKEQLMKKYQSFSNRTPQKMKYSLNRMNGKITAKNKSNSKEDIGKIIKSQPYQYENKEKRGYYFNTYDTSEEQKSSNIQSLHTNLQCLKYNSLQKNAREILQKNFSPKFISKKHYTDRQIEHHCLKRHYTQSIQKYIHNSEQISTLDPWQTEIIVDL